MNFTYYDCIKYKGQDTITPTVIQSSSSKGVLNTNLVFSYTIVSATFW